MKLSTVLGKPGCVFFRITIFAIVILQNKACSSAFHHPPGPNKYNVLGTGPKQFLCSVLTCKHFCNSFTLLAGRTQEEQPGREELKVAG